MKFLRFMKSNSNLIIENFESSNEKFVERQWKSNFLNSEFLDAINV